METVALIILRSNGIMMIIDTSTPARFIIKLALADRAIVKVKVRKPQFASLDVGASVKFMRWVRQIW
jgi:hypothetical protein